MSAFLDRYHDAYHVGAVVDLINCPLCQDEFIAWQREQYGTIDPVTGRCIGPNDVPPPNVDRMEDLPAYEPAR